MIDIMDASIAVVFASFAVYCAVLLAERWDPQASRWPL